MPKLEPGHRQVVERRHQRRASWTTLAPYAPRPPDAGRDPCPRFSTQRGACRPARAAQLRGASIVHLSQQAADQGVIFTDLATAVREYPDLVQPAPVRRTSRPTPTSSPRSTPRSGRGGLFLYVPQDVVARSAAARPDLGGRHGRGHLRPYADRGRARSPRCAWSKSTAPATATASARSATANGQPTTLYSGVVEIAAGDGRQGRVFHHRELGAGGLHLQPAPGRRGPQRHACTGSSACSAGGSTAAMWTPNWPSRAPKRRRAASTSPGSDQAFDLTSLTHHIAEDCTGDILFKGALRDDARAGFDGMIRVEHGGAADQLLPVRPHPLPQRPGQGRQRARPGNPGQRREVLARRDHRHD